jgi:Mg-chelatase subunit ChlD
VTSNNHDLMIKAGVKVTKNPSDILISHGVKLTKQPDTDHTDKVLLVLLDKSGSMAQEMERLSKLGVAWQVLQSQLAPNMIGWNYGILGFEGDETSWEIYPCKDVQALVSASQPHPGADTPMHLVLEVAYGWSKEHAKQVRFILMTDGMPTDSGKEEIYDLCRNKGIPIDTVGIGAGTYGYDPVFLRHLSELTGGVFTEAKSVMLLTETIKQLAPANRPLLGYVK